MADNIWGSGGLFEQALASKLALQDSMRQENLATAGLRNSMVGVDRMNADTNRLNSDRQYDIGLRKDKVDVGQLGVNRGQLDVNRGQLDVNRGQLDVNRGLADVSRFRADTERGLLAGRMSDPFTAEDIRNNGLSTFSAPRSSSSSLLPSAQGSILRRGSSFSDGTMGFRDGGVALKPKMVKQPGYMNGGKIKMPKGYKKGGTIGEVEKDDGTDKVEVMAREGEYFLNPETVATAFGGGDYKAGVRNLNQIVRESTGKEPGPSPVGKSGKQGLAASGVPEPNEEYFRRAALDRMAAEKAAARAATPSGSTIYVDPKGTASTAQPAGMGAAETGRAAGRVAGQGAAILREAAPTLRSAAGAALMPAIAGAEMVSNVNDKKDFYNDPKVPTFEKGKQWLRDIKNPTAMAIGGTIGAGAGAGLASIATGAAGAAAGRGLASLADDEGAAYKAYREANPKPVAAPVVAEKPQEAPKGNAPERDFDKEVRDKLAESEAKKSTLRDMMQTRYNELAADRRGQGSISRLEEMQNLVSNLTKLEEQDLQSARLANTAATTAAAKKVEDSEKKVEDSEKYLRERLQSPKTDKDGNVTGYFEDPTKLAAFKDYVANLKEKGTDAPFNFVNRPRTEQDRILEDFSRKYEMTKRFNERFGSESGGQPTSVMPRVDEQGLRYAVDPGTGKIHEMGVGDILNEGVSLGDWLTSFGPNQTEKRLVFDPVTKKMIAARHVVGTDADIDAQLHGATNEYVKGLRKQPEAKK